jgi:prophage regulatory protein
MDNGKAIFSSCYIFNPVRAPTLEQQMAAINSSAPIRLVKKPTVLDRTGLSNSSLYEKMAAGLFPRSVKIGQRSVAWREHEIEEWIESRTRNA